MSRPVLALLLLLSLLRAATAAAGTLEIETQPGVDVFWEGIYLATTDGAGRLAVEDVPAGPYELTLAREGFEELTIEVEIGDGTTRLNRRLAPVAAQPPVPAAAGPDSATARPAAAADAARAETANVSAGGRPSVRVSTGAWLAGLAILGTAAALAIRWRLRPSAPPPPPSSSRKRVRKVTRAASGAGGGFLSELRQRERALDELVDVSGESERDGTAAEPEVVDAVWKEIE